MKNETRNRSFIGAFWIRMTVTLNGYTRQLYTKCKVLLTSSDISDYLRESRFENNQFENGFL